MRILGTFASVACAAALLTTDPGRADGQSSASWYASWHCRGSSTQFQRCVDAMGATSGTRGPFSTRSACEAWSAGIPAESYCYTPSSSAGGSSGGGSSGGSGDNNSSSSFDIGRCSVSCAWVLGGVPGLLIGSYLTFPPDTVGHFTLGGFAIGAGVFGTLELAERTRSIPPSQLVAFAAINGAMLGGAYGSYQQRKHPSPDTTITERSEVTRNALIGAGVSVALFVIPAARNRGLQLGASPQGFSVSYHRR